MPADAERSALVQAHIWIVAQFAAKYASKARGVDLAEAGLLGLCEAALKYKPGRGVKFATYAWTWVKGRVLEEIRLAHVVPVSKRAALGKTREPVELFTFCGEHALERLQAPAPDERTELDGERLRIARRKIGALPTADHRRAAFRALRGRSVEQIAQALELAPERVTRLLAEAEALLGEAA